MESTVCAVGTSPLGGDTAAGKAKTPLEFEPAVVESALFLSLFSQGPHHDPQLQARLRAHLHRALREQRRGEEHPAQHHPPQALLPPGVRDTRLHLLPGSDQHQQQKRVRSQDFSPLQRGTAGALLWKGAKEQLLPLLGAACASWGSAGGSCSPFYGPSGETQGKTREASSFLLSAPSRSEVSGRSGGWEPSCCRFPLLITAAAAPAPASC